MSGRATGLTGIDELGSLLGLAFSAEQQTAITAPLCPGVIIAGAGTGKTTVMAARVVWLVGTGQVTPEGVLGLTFTRKAAQELGQRVHQALAKAGLDGDPLAGRVTVSTYDAFAGQLLAEHGLRAGVESDLRLISGAVRHRLAAQVVADWPAELAELGQLRLPTVIERVLRLDQELRNHLVDRDEVLEYDAAFAAELGEAGLYRGKPTVPVRKARAAVAGRAELLALVAAYRRAKAERGLVEFADQMAAAAELAGSVPQVGRQLRRDFPVVLLDEYQDTSSAQALLLRELFSGPTPGQGRGHPVTAVGDPFQAIYGWRGAAPSNILRFASDFPTVDGQPAARYGLTVNRRSGPEILQVANLLAAPLRADGRLQRAGDRQQAMQVAIDGQLRAPGDAEPARLEAVSFDTWPQEASWLAERVIRAQRSGEAGKWSDIAVLTRQNAPLAGICRELEARGVPVEVVGLGGLLELPEVAEVVATLRLIDDVGANPEVLRLLSGDRWRIGVSDLAALGTRAAQLAALHRPGTGTLAGDPGRSVPPAQDPSELPCLLDAIADPGDAPLSAVARARLARFGAELQQLRRHRDEPVLELTSRVIDRLGIAIELDSDPEWFAARRSRQLTRFLDALTGYVDIDGNGSLHGLLAWLQAELDHAEGLDQLACSAEDSVKLLTVHRAKGLEWDVVLLPLLCDRVFPSAQAADNWTTQPQVLPAELRGDRDWVPQLAEPTTQALKSEYPAELRVQQRQSEDRLSYVAATRARRLLVGSCHHWVAGRQGVREPSPYFKALVRVATAAGMPVLLAERSASNPLEDRGFEWAWPVAADPSRQARLAWAAEQVRRVAVGEPDPVLLADPSAVAQQAKWHRLGAGLVAEARLQRVRRQTVPLPVSLSASAVLLANRDPSAFAGELARPMPRPVTRRAGIGTRFHQWLAARFGPPMLFDDLDLPDDPLVEDTMTDRQFDRLVRAFERGCYADRVPVAIEEPFIATLGAHQIRGRIDAVFETLRDPDHDYQVVDWKTANSPADPLQLALYRYAWARSVRIDPARVDAVFYHVLTDRVERPTALPDEAELIDLLVNLRNSTLAGQERRRLPDGGTAELGSLTP